MIVSFSLNSSENLADFKFKKLTCRVFKNQEMWLKKLFDVQTYYLFIITCAVCFLSQFVGLPHSLFICMTFFFIIIITHLFSLQGHSALLCLFFNRDLHSRTTLEDILCVYNFLTLFILDLRVSCLFHSSYSVLCQTLWWPNQRPPGSHSSEWIRPALLWLWITTL